MIFHFIHPISWCAAESGCTLNGDWMYGEFLGLYLSFDWMFVGQTENLTTVISHCYCIIWWCDNSSLTCWCSPLSACCVQSFLPVCLSASHFGGCELLQLLGSWAHTNPVMKSLLAHSLPCLKAVLQICRFPKHPCSLTKSLGPSVFPRGGQVWRSKVKPSWALGWWAVAELIEQQAVAGQDWSDWGWRVRWASGSVGHTPLTSTGSSLCSLPPLPPSPFSFSLSAPCSSSSASGCGAQCPHVCTFHWSGHSWDCGDRPPCHPPIGPSLLIWQHNGSRHALGLPWCWPSLRGGGWRH